MRGKLVEYINEHQLSDDRRRLRGATRGNAHRERASVRGFVAKDKRVPGEGPAFGTGAPLACPVRAALRSGHV